MRAGLAALPFDWSGAGLSNGFAGLHTRTGLKFLLRQGRCLKRSFPFGSQIFQLQTRQIEPLKGFVLYGPESVKVC